MAGDARQPPGRRSAVKRVVELEDGVVARETVPFLGLRRYRGVRPCAHVRPRHTFPDSCLRPRTVFCERIPATAFATDGFSATARTFMPTGAQGSAGSFPPKTAAAARKVRYYELVLVSYCNEPPTISSLRALTI